MMLRRRFLIALCAALGVALADKSVASGLASVAPALPATGTATPAPGMFLVARRSLDDPHFRQSVVYLVTHDEGGTLGLIVNRRGNISLSEALPDIEDAQATEHALYFGGPVALSVILMLTRGESAIEGMTQVIDDIYISSERRVLDQVIAAAKPASEVRFYIGHSGWAAGQLDSELERGGWHVVKADPEAVFSSDAGSLWQRLIEQLEPAGIQANSRSSSRI